MHTRRTRRSILHVLPHPGGGGETYVDTLERMDGYHFHRFYLAPGPDPRAALSTLWRTALSVQGEARRHDIIHVHGEVASAITLPSLALKPSVVTLHGLHLLRRVKGQARKAARVNLRLIVRAASRTICVSESERTEVAEEVPHADARVVVIHNGVDAAPSHSEAERARARKALGIRDGTVAAAWVGSLDERKDPVVAAEAAIEAARIGSHFSLLIAGEGPLREELERLAAMGSAVRVLGFRRDVRKVLEAADVFVLTSRREGLPYALLEAMAMGLPVVVSDAPDNVEAAGEAGIVVPRSDAGALAAAFARLANDETVRAELGDRARKRVAEYYSADEMVEQTKGVYETILRQTDR